MNAAIAELLRDRISAFSYVDKIAGLVRPITFQRAGKEITIPVGIDVTDPLECSEDTQLALVPDERYGVIVYFEDRGAGVEKEGGRERQVSNLRLVCWVNTMKLNGDATAAGRIMQEFKGAISGSFYNSAGYLRIFHKVSGYPPKGPSLFSPYTYPEGVRQYLLPPFDAFAIDIRTTYMVDASCIVPIDPTDVNCWTPQPTTRRRHPKDFTCEELTDPVTGLTDEQLGPDCLDCEGGGVCDPANVTINGVEVATPASGATAELIVEDQDGNPIGSLVAGRWVVTISEDVPYIVQTYATLSEAEADSTTIVPVGRAIVVAGRLYQGTGTASDDLVGAGVFNPSVEEPGDGNLLTIVDNTQVKIQLNQ